MEADITQSAIDWKTAEAHEGSLSVSLEPAPSTDWRKRFRAVAAQLERTEMRWGTVAVRKDRVTVDDIAEGAEADVRHFLESIVLQANAGENDGTGDEQGHDSPDERMTEAFRAFAADGVPERST